VSAIEKVISDEESKGRRVRAFVFNNPQNPLGKVYSAETVLEIMIMCQRFDILISSSSFFIPIHMIRNPYNKLLKTLFQKNSILCKYFDLIFVCLNLCRRRIHLIADEMYCMSVFDSDTRFHSVLEIYQTELLDSNLLHLIWGFSKVTK
jgi:aspartate/methionine/tyrosine aminotransferase